MGINYASMKKHFQVEGKSYVMYGIRDLEAAGIGSLDRLPFSIRILVENLLRNYDNGKTIDEEALRDIVNWKPAYETPREIAYYPGRVLMQDFTGVPGIVDLATMRDAMKSLGKDPSLINPIVPVEMIVDHSVQIDYYGEDDSLEKNVAKEYERNSERYRLLKWAQKAFKNIRIVPPNSGICHQVNLEYLGRVAMTKTNNAGETEVFPDSLVGTDSHTTMINGIGVMGWGVGGIEAEAVMLGQPYYMPIPEVVGVRLHGSLREGVTATDLVLRITEMLRKHKVVEKFVEFYGPGVKALSVVDRATIANMAPEYGATMGFFPVDEKTIEYLHLTNRSEAALLTEYYTKTQKLFYEGHEQPEYSSSLELDLDTIVPSMAGPSRPQDRVNLESVAQRFADVFGSEKKPVELTVKDKKAVIDNGSVVIAAITSCTNTSNPSVMIGAGLVAKKAVEKGLKVQPHVKTSLAPGSKVVTRYLSSSGLLPHLEALGFGVTAYGCTTCIGNSGPLDANIEQAIKDKDLAVASVLSGNRNFEARVHQSVKANFLASPPLVVVYALTGRVDMDITTEPIGTGSNGQPVYLKDIWPTSEEIQDAMAGTVSPAVFEQEYSQILDGDHFWRALEVPEGETFQWDEKSTYIRRPTFFDNVGEAAQGLADLEGARILLALGDSVTTDHISPAGSIPRDYPAGKYLISHGVDFEDFNSYGSRRGNHEVMMRGTFANVRIKNALAPEKQGSWTRKYPDGKLAYVYDAAMEYAWEGIPLIVLGGKEYGTGSSRDWAAKGTLLLGIKAVITESFERIHRSNLVGMGVLPMVFKEGQSWSSLGLKGDEVCSVLGISSLSPGKELTVVAVSPDGSRKEFQAIAKVNTQIEVEYLQAGGILTYVLRRMG
ncbi:aconitate hydratase 1 [Desulfurispirillum indicum S5]|uniref:Aconitate hydratase n=1 Tax=Desulfurispirillum indicum (strain ATCC BAA-1389 / DSM 22839 / S5) TaxID=653733 RepID=E6W264_DESIS|nr:aconitate hydratase AcnA [Desulfurispirillum indicum]ADU65522.1 aconitate hydratase 1 [Desulfurispirillum indicum S5]